MENLGTDSWDSFNATHTDSSSAHVKAADSLTNVLGGSECRFGMCDIDKYVCEMLKGCEGADDSDGV